VDQIKSQVDSLSELSDEQVSELQTAIVSEFEKVESQDISPETVDAMSSLADMLDTVRGDIQRRELQAEELASRASEAAMRVKGEGEGDMAQGEGNDVAPMEEVIPTDEPVAPAEEESKPEGEMGEMPVTPEDEDAPVVPAEEEEEDKPMGEYSTETSVDASISTEETLEFSTEATPEVVEPTEGGEIATEETPNIETPTVEEVPQEEQVTVTASAEEGFSAPADRQPVIQVNETAQVAITAGADIPGYTAGSTIDSISEVAVAMEKRIHSLRRVNGGDGEQHIVASFSTLYPEERTLSTDPESNKAKIDAVVGQQALVASGGHAAPFEVKYDIFGLGSTTDRPVRDLLPKFQADRGGVRFVTPPTLISLTNANANAASVYDYANAVGLWNETTATPSVASFTNNIGDSTTTVKGSLTVAAAAEQTAQTDAVTLQLQFGNLMTRAYPELISRHNELALVQHAREAELNLINKISGFSKAVNAHVATTEAANLIGVARDFLIQVRKAAVAYRSRHRLSPETRLKAIIPAWIYDAMAADLALNMPGDGNLGVGAAEIKGYLSGSNVDLVASLDMNSFGAQPGDSAKLLEFPDSFSWYLFAEGSFLFLDGGTLDLGIIRDSSLVNTNDYKMFIETFEGVAFVGVESLKITTNISVNGVAAALRDTTGGATAAAIEE
jgi:Asp-tRNA(Asn)/Glu-tRNA(Gln) amidotransferase C subunit